MPSKGRRSYNTYPNATPAEDLIASSIHLTTSPRQEQAVHLGLKTALQARKRGAIQQNLFDHGLELVAHTPHLSGTMNNAAITLKCPNCGGVFMTLQHSSGSTETCPHCAAAAPRIAFQPAQMDHEHRSRTSLPARRPELPSPAAPAAPPAPALPTVVTQVPVPMQPPLYGGPLAEPPTPASLSPFQFATAPSPATPTVPGLSFQPAAADHGLGHGQSYSPPSFPAASPIPAELPPGSVAPPQSSIPAAGWSTAPALTGSGGLSPFSPVAPAPPASIQDPMWAQRVTQPATSPAPAPTPSWPGLSASGEPIYPHAQHPAGPTYVQPPPALAPASPAPLAPPTFDSEPIRASSLGQPVGNRLPPLRRPLDSADTITRPATRSTIPTHIPQPPPTRRRGVVTGLILLLLLAGAATYLYLFQPQIVHRLMSGREAVPDTTAPTPIPHLPTSPVEPLATPGAPEPEPHLADANASIPTQEAPTPATETLPPEMPESGSIPVAVPAPPEPPASEPTTTQVDTAPVTPPPAPTSNQPAFEEMRRAEPANPPPDAATGQEMAPPADTRSLTQQISLIMNQLHASSTVAERLELITGPKGIDQDVQRIFGEKKASQPALVSVDPKPAVVIEIPSQAKTLLFRVYTSGQLVPDIFKVGANDTSENLKLDWPLFQQFHDRTFDEYKKSQTTSIDMEARWFRVLGRLSHDFSLNPNIRQEYLCLQLQGSFVSGDLTAYVPLNSPTGRFLTSQLAWSRIYLVELLIGKQKIDGVLRNIVLDCKGSPEAER